MQPRIRTDSKVVKFEPLYFWDQTGIFWDKENVTWDAGISVDIVAPTISLENITPNILSKSTTPRIRVD